MLNKAFLIGRLGRDPDLRYTADGKAVARFRLAATTRLAWDDDGRPREETEWFTVFAFGRQAEACAQGLRKGDPVFVEGRIRSHSWTDASGVARCEVQVLARRVLFLKGRPQEEEAPELFPPEDA